MQSQYADGNPLLYSIGFFNEFNSRLKRPIADSLFLFVLQTDQFQSTPIIEKDMLYVDPRPKLIGGASRTKKNS